MDKKLIISSDRSISSQKSKDKDYYVPVKNYPKLFLLVRPNGTKSWAYRYYPPNTSKQIRISLGVYPSVTLARACDIWREYEDLLNKGIDPKIHREESKQAELKKSQSTFSHFAWQHFDELEKTHKANTITRKKGRYQLLCDYLGKMPIDDIEQPKMLEVLIDIQNNSLNSQGKPTDKAERCAGIASDIFKYAGARGFCKTNPADMVKGQLASYHYNHRPAVTKPHELAKLLRDIETLAVDLNTINSLRLLAMLFVRNGDLRRVKWADLELDKARWYLNPLKGKGKENMVREMVVPLPQQAVTIFKEQQKINGHQEYVFYSASAKKHGILSENTANNRLKDLGYQNVHCVHGFRATAKTILQEQLKYPLVIVEMALGHVTKDPNGTAYGRFQFLDDREEMMIKWADYLDALREGRDTEQFKHGTNATPAEQLQALIDSLGKDKVMEMLNK